MHKQLELPPVEVNVRLLEVETRLTEVFEERSPFPDDAVRDIVNAIELSGCDSYLKSKRIAQKQASIEVLALDLAWVKPGPYKTWAGEGKQICFCRHQGRSTGAQETWYARSLQEYFGAANARSLLTLPFIYSKKSFVQVKWLTETQPFRPRKTLKRIIKGQQVKVWNDTFDPVGRDATKSVEWFDRFTAYRALILQELQRAVPSYKAADAMIAWIYGGPGAAADDAPPPWGASLFLIFRLINRAAVSTPILKQNVEILLSNLHNIFRNVAPAALGGRREKQNLAQAWSHEFKNLTQDIATLSQLVRDKPARRLAKENGADHKIHRGLHLGIQAVNAFSRVAYWLFSPKDGRISLTPDPGARAFRHALALAVHLVEPCRIGWEISGLPSIEEISNFFQRITALRSPSVYKMTEHLPICFLLFFALEPVRNIQCTTGSIHIQIRGSGKRVTLHQITQETTPAQRMIRSESIEFLMSQVNAYSSVKLIEIDPVIKVRLGKASADGLRTVERITTFVVHHIYPLQK